MTQQPPGEPQREPHVPPITKLRPQKGLFIILCIVMVLWIAGLITMYFTTVWPKRHAPTPREIDVDDHHPTTMTG